MSVRKIQTVGVIGAGTMGQGIAQVSATSGFDVLLFDVNQEFLKKALSLVEASLQTSVEKSKLTAVQKQEAISKIKLCTSLDQVRADLIIEAAVEKLEVKKRDF